MTDSDFHCQGKDARQVLEQLRGLGVDLARPREAIFYFYGDSEAEGPAEEAELEKLGRVRDAMTALGFFATVSRRNLGVTASIETVVSAAWLAEVMAAVRVVAEATGIEWDGWEASVAADE